MSLRKDDEVTPFRHWVAEQTEFRTTLLNWALARE